MVLGEARIVRATAATAPLNVASTLVVAETPATPRTSAFSLALSFWCTSRLASSSRYAPAVAGGRATSFSGAGYVNCLRQPPSRSPASFQPSTMVPAEVQAT